MKKAILQQTIRIAVSKLPEHPERGNFPHYAFIVQNNKIMEWATNSVLEPPVHYGYHQKEEDVTFVPKFHAEIWAYRRARGLLDKRKGFEVVNVRLNKSGDVKFSKPCRCCFGLLSALGCEKFHYSSSLGFMCLAAAEV